MTSSACGMVGVLLAETSPSSRAARLRSSSLDLDFPGAAAELRLSNIAVGNISIRRSLERELKKLGGISAKPGSATRYGSGCARPRLDRSTTCSQDGALLTPAKLESYLFSI